MKIKQGFLFGFFFIFLVFSSFFTFSNTLDPDFGWHIKTGQLILEKGVPYQDWYSYTMPDFPWVDHEWLLDVVMYKIYAYSGINVLLLVFLSLYALSFFIIKKPQQEFFTFFIPVILGYLATFYFLGIRPQLLSVLLVALLIKVIDNFLEHSSKSIYLLPLLFLLWVNIHASFFAGLVILAMIIFLEVFKKYKIWQKFPPAPRLRWAGKILRFFDNLSIQEHSFEKIKTLVFVFITCFLMTLLNPYVFRIYEEVFRTTGDNFLRFNIAEWLPLFFSGFKPFIYFYIGLFVGLLLLYYKKVELNKIVLSLFFLVLALTGIRYMLIFVIVSLPVLIDLMSLLKGEANFQMNYRLFHKLDKFFFIIVALLVVVVFVYGFYDFYSGILGDEFYPTDALPFIKTLPLQDNIFHYYGWGGYLILHIPDRKYFIDGRMPSWREDDTFVFGDYVDIIKAKDGFERHIDTYDIKYIILQRVIKERDEYYKNNLVDEKVRTFFKQYKWAAFLFGISTDDNIYGKLKDMGWQEIYEDKTTLILKK